MLIPSSQPKHGKLFPALADDEEAASLIPSTEESEDGKYGTFQESKHLQQGLHERHMRMLGLAGGIGTGLFLNTGRGLALGGPLGSLIGYTVIGAVCCGVILGVGEMGALVPLSGGSARYAEYFVDPALSFAIGWNMIYACFISLPAETTAASILIRFWVETSNAVWITVFIAMVLLTALLFVRVFGEIEYFASWLKILLIVFLNLLAIYISCGIGSKDAASGFQYWHAPGPFVQYLEVPGPLGRFLGVWACSRTAFYAYSGLESLAVAAGEARNPRRAIPMAAKRVFLRVVLFYILTMFTLGLLIPSDDPALLRSTGTVSQSPFVIAARRAGIKSLPSVVNTVTLVTAWSAANNSMLHGTRYLFGLASSGRASRVFLKLNRFGVPYVAIALHGIFMCFAYFTAYASMSAFFSWLQSLISVAALMNWITICVSYLRFYYACKVQGIDRKKELPWAAPFQPYVTWFSLILLCLILAAGSPTVFVPNKIDVRDVVSAYFNIPLMLILYLGYKVVKKTHVVPLEEIPLRHLIDKANAELDATQPV